MKKISIIVVFMMLTSCANAPLEATNKDINTVAKPQLQRDVMNTIGLYESAVGGSNHPKLVKVEHIDTVQDNGAVTSVKEEWMVDSNGKNASYIVEFIPTPSRGGTDFAVTRKRAP